MRVLYLEDRQIGRDNIDDYNQERHEIDFVDTITAFDEFLYEMNGYEKYDAVVIDLAIDMPLLTKDDIVNRIPELNRDEIPTKCIGITIPLYGLDYFKYVIAVRPETENMLKDGRVLFFSGHAKKAKNRGLYDENMEIFKHTKMFDRAERGTTKALFEEFEKIEEARQRK